jgi:hypothetical protein
MNPAPVPSIGMLGDDGQPIIMPCAGGVYECALASSLTDVELDADTGLYIIGRPRHYCMSAKGP